MTDDHELDGLDPYDLLDAEAARIDAYLSSLDEAAWQQPSRCEGWTRRDLAAHLAAVEDYHHACLDDRVVAFIEEGMASGVASLDDFNQLGVQRRADRPAAEVVAEWREADADTRRRMRARDGEEMGSSIGPYPVRWQAFHVASELATHADDLGVPVTPDEAAGRVAWRARFSRFSLPESKPGVEVTPVAGGTRVRIDDVDEVLDDEPFVEAVAGRLTDDAGVSAELRAALSTMP